VIKRGQLGVRQISLIKKKCLSHLRRPGLGAAFEDQEMSGAAQVSAFPEKQEVSGRDGFWRWRRYKAQGNLWQKWGGGTI
jgi:hypothetical protein